MAYETIYQRASDEVAQNATITIEVGTDLEDDDYAPASLVDGNPAKVAKIGSVTGTWQFTFDSPQRVDLVALIHHNFDAGANVRLQGSSGGSPWTTDFEAAITIPSWLGSGTSRWPVNPWRDLTLVSGYSASGFQYWRLVVTGNSQNLELGEIWLGSQIRRLSPDLRWEYVPMPRKPIIRHTTAFEVETLYSKGTTRWQLEGSIPQDDDLERDLEAHWYDVDGVAKPWLLIPQPPGSSSSDIMTGRDNRAYLVRYASEQRPIPHIVHNTHENRLIVQEVGRGLRPGT